MKIRYMLLALVLGACLGFLYLHLTEKPKTISSFASQPASLPLPTWTPTPSYLNADTLFSLVNNWRTSENRKPFIKNDHLCDIAKSRLPEIKNDWSHSLFFTHMQNGSYCPKGCSLAENLAKEEGVEDQTLDAWLHSASHAANLRGSYTKSCIATDGSYAVQIFGY